MATDTPVEPKEPERPKSLVEKLGAALPVGLTAIATVFAGMSTGELQKAMYWKSQAAQDQAKATNQWTLAGFKRDRSLVMEAAAAQLRAAAGYPDNPFAAPPPSAAQVPDARALEWLAGKGPPRAYRRADPDADKAAPAVGLPPVGSPELTALLDAVQRREPEAETLRLAGLVRMDAVNKAIDDAEAANDRITEQEWGAVVSAARRAVAGRAKGPPAERTAAQAALYELEQRRYRSEATLNQDVGFLFEARVKVTSAESDRHRRKSEYFFYAMLAAQIGAVVSSLALARRTGSVLWLVAGLAGAAALGFGAVVFLDKLPGT